MRLEIFRGKTWKFGHHIDTDIIIPARHLVLPLDQSGDRIAIDPATGEIHLPRRQMTFSGTRLPDFLLAILAAGGLIAHLAQRMNTAWIIGTEDGKDGQKPNTG